MSKKIFRSSFLVAILVLVVTVSLLMGILFNYFENQMEKELQSELSYITHAIEREGLSYLDGLENDTNRITVLDTNGNVLFDTTADARELDNHSDREEIKEALKTGTGKSTRYSDTLAEKTVYYAAKLDDCIVRISTQQYTAMTILLALSQPIIAVLVIAVLLCLFLSNRVSKSITDPINSIDLDRPEKSEVYEELEPLMKKLATQKQTITHQLNDAIKHREEFTLITENMSEGLLMIDKKTTLLTHNSAALKHLGITTPVAGSVLELCRVKEFRDAIETALSGEKATQTMKLDGSSFRLIADPVFDENTLVGAVIIIIDITESENRESLRREFTANVSHELKTPLTSISGFAELMKTGDTPGETVVDFSESIFSEAQRLITLVNDIIKISELDEKSIPFESEPVNLQLLAREIIERLTPAAKKKNVSLNLSGEAVEINGVKKIIDEMIYNLCDNAIKYNIENGSVDITVSAIGSKAHVIVRDTGIGIPAADQSRVFERFYRVDKSHSKKVGGTGLGLAIVKHGAIYHNAEVTLESFEDKGTSVAIIFNK